MFSLLVSIYRGNTFLVLTYLLDRLAVKCKFVHFPILDFFSVLVQRHLLGVYTLFALLCGSFKYGDTEASDADPTY